jgi:hypothetical protein
MLRLLLSDQHCGAQGTGERQPSRYSQHRAIARDECILDSLRRAIRAPARSPTRSADGFKQIIWNALVGNPHDLVDNVGCLFQLAFTGESRHTERR